MASFFSSSRARRSFCRAPASCGCCEPPALRRAAISFLRSRIVPHNSSMVASRALSVVAVPGFAFTLAGVVPRVRYARGLPERCCAPLLRLLPEGGVSVSLRTAGGCSRLCRSPKLSLLLRLEGTPLPCRCPSACVTAAVTSCLNFSSTAAVMAATSVAETVGGIMCGPGEGP